MNEEISATIEELAASASEIHEMARIVANGAQGAVQANIARDANVIELNRIMNNLKMLAINARIESAHAGEFGRGFAVVADEIGNTAILVQELLQTSREASKVIGAAAQQGFEMSCKMADATQEQAAAIEQIAAIISNQID